MTIHVVKQGETLESIAQTYGTTITRLIQDNEIQRSIVVGEALIIVYPKQTHTIRSGETLRSIADNYGVTEMELLRNNIFLLDEKYIHPGVTIVISFEDKKIAEVSVNGYAYQFVDRNILKNTLPYLTYLSIMQTQVFEDAHLVGIDDGELIQMAKQYGVEPIMLIYDAKPGVAAAILKKEELKEKFIDNILTLIEKKGYSGVSLNPPYIMPENRESYYEFAKNITKRLNQEGYIVFDTLGITFFEISTGNVYKGRDYKRLFEVTNGVTLLPQDIGEIVRAEPGRTIAFVCHERFLNNMVQTAIPEKMMYVVPNMLGYIWALPYEVCVSKGNIISYNNAIKNAQDYGAEILYDDIAKISYYNYLDINDYVVRFWDARGIEAFAKLIAEYKLAGFVNLITQFNNQKWTIINTQFNIRKKGDSNVPATI